MKQHFIFGFLSFFICYGACFSQAIDFPENNAVWKESQITIAGPITQYFALCGDTVFNNVPYSKVVQLQVDSQLQVTGSYYWGGLRQNGGLVYFFYNGSPNEFLLYDFSLETGDEISLTVFGSTQTTRKVDSTDVQLIAGQMRKVIYFEKENPDCPEPPEFWVEGIGSSYGLLTRALDPCFVADAGGQLLCFGHEGEYLNLTLIECFLPDLIDCGFTSATGDIFKKQLELIISPNPSSNHISINLNNNQVSQNWELSIFNSFGEIVMTGINKSENKLELDIAHLPSGIYFIKMVDEKNTEMGVGRFLKI